MCRTLSLSIAILASAASAALAGAYAPGDFLIADFTGDRVGIFDAQMQFKSYLVTGLDRATGVDVRRDGTAVVASQATTTGEWGDVRQFSPAGTQLRSFSHPQFPVDVKFSPSQTILLSTQQGVVEEHTWSGGFIGTFFEARLNDPQSLAVVGATSLWVGEGENDSIRIFDLATRTLQRTVALDNGQLSASSMSYSDATGTVLIADSTTGWIFERIGSGAGTGAFQRVFKPGPRKSPLGGVVRTAAGEVWATDNGTGDLLRYQADGTYLGLSTLRSWITTPGNIVQVPLVPEPTSAATLAVLIAAGTRRRRPPTTRP
jgi:hypothetical protein